jgi:hypothetical protein
MVALPSVSIDFQTLLYILLVIGGLSGWIALIFDRLSERPKIRGRILQVMRGQFQNPENSVETLTSFTLFLYLTNTRKSRAHLIDYALSISTARFRFQKMKLGRGIPPDMKFHFNYQGRELNIPDFTKRLLHRQSEAIEFGVPFIGFLLFGGDLKFYKADIRRYKMICTDVFGHKHKIVANPKRFENLLYIQDLFGVEGLTQASPPRSSSLPVSSATGG